MNEFVEIYGSNFNTNIKGLISRETVAEGNTLFNSIFDRFDNNQDNKLDEMELKSLIETVLLFDKNNNKKLTEKELMKFIENNYLNFCTDGAGNVKQLDIKGEDVGQFFQKLNTELSAHEYNETYISQDAKTIADDFLTLLKEKDPNINQILELIKNTNYSAKIKDVLNIYNNHNQVELLDEIRNNLHIKDSDKEILIREICGLYNSFSDIETNQSYDAFATYKNTQISNEYYTGANYDVQFNGPIIVIINKDKNETSRINLLELLGSFSDKNVKLALPKIQSLPAEILENISKELKTIKPLSDEQPSDILAQYLAFWDTMATSNFEPWVIVHELGHAIDFQAPKGFYNSSSNNKFLNAYNNARERLVANGIPIYKGEGERSEFGNHYSTLNEHEGYAVCFQLLMGYEDDSTKFVREYMPEIIEPAKNLYLKIKDLPKEERSL